MSQSIKGFIAFLTNIFAVWIGSLNESAIVVVFLLFSIIHTYIGLKAINSKETVSGVLFLIFGVINFGLFVILGSYLLHT